MVKQDDSYFGIVHRAEQAQLKAERSPAPNTPTPELELVERLRKEIPYNADGFSELRDIADEAAATIVNLTAERDAAREQLQRQFDQTVRFQGYLVDEKSKAEAAEKRVKELEAHIEELQEKNAAETCACSYDNAGDVCMGHSPALAASETANKLLSERVAVLETALEPFARYATDPFDKDHKGYPFPDGQGVGWVYLTHADFRRALAAREAK